MGVDPRKYLQRALGSVHVPKPQLVGRGAGEHSQPIGHDLHQRLYAHSIANDQKVDRGRAVHVEGAQKMGGLRSDGTEMVRDGGGEIRLGLKVGLCR